MHADGAIYRDLNACSVHRDVCFGRVSHAFAVECQAQMHISFMSTLINMYTKCSIIVEAHLVFDNVENPDAVCWTTLILGYAEHGEGYTALELFSKMKACGCTPDSVTYVAALKACTSLLPGNGGDALQWGREIHVEAGCHLNIYVQNALIDMYGKLGCIHDARKVFEKIERPTVVSWTSLILGYAENGQPGTALDLFAMMKWRGCTPSSFTYVAVLKACTRLVENNEYNAKAELLTLCNELHLEVDNRMNHHVQIALVELYVNLGSITEARRVFDSIRNPCVVCWTMLIMGYVDHGEPHTALDLFSHINATGVTPNSFTYVSVLKACTVLALNGDYNECLRHGREIHLEMGFHLDHHVQTALIDMYTKSGSIDKARSVFDSIHKPSLESWNALLLGYAGYGQGRFSLDLFSTMKERGCEPDSLTYVAALKSCACLPAGDGLQRGREIHFEVGSHLDHNVQSALIHMYSKCGSMSEAQEVFDNSQKPDIVSWTSLLLGYVDNGDGHNTLRLFYKMEFDGILPNSVTYIAVIKACCLMGALVLGRNFHSEVREFTAEVVTCLVDFFAKCGSMVEALEVFNLHSKVRTLSTWNALLAGYSRLGYSDTVFDLLEKMQGQGVQPDGVTFVCLLLCCSHGGFVDKARMFFEAMPSKYGLTPSLMHYNCMVDVLGRANQLNEAISMIKKMPWKPNVVTWVTLLAACRKWNNMEIGEEAFQALQRMDKKNTAAYSLMVDIYGNQL